MEVTKRNLLEYENIFLSVVKKANKYNMNRPIELFRVGGFVRDTLLGLESKDVDYLVTNVAYNDLYKILNQYFGKIISTDVGDSMNCIKVSMPNNEVYDFTIPRKDICGLSGSHTDTKVIGDPSMSVIDDMGRRDFTMNAIAYNVETKEYIDPYNGQLDLECKVIRCVGDPNLRFKEDALRIFRAIQFAVRFDFELNIATKYGIINNRPLLSKITNERIVAELDKMFLKSAKPGNKKVIRLLNLVYEYIWNDAEYEPKEISKFYGDPIIGNYVALYINDNKYETMKLPSRVKDIITICKSILRDPSDVNVFNLLYKKEHLLMEVYDALCPKEYLEYLNDFKLSKIIEKPMSPNKLDITSEQLMNLGVEQTSLGKVQKDLCLLVFLGVLDNCYGFIVDELKTLGIKP